MANYTPFAQTFFVDPTQNPNGIFVKAIDLVFSTADDILPITLQLRPVTGGFPDSIKTYAFASATLYPDKINLVTGVGTDLPSFTDSTKYTRFTFEVPVYLASGEHAIVLKTNSAFYNVYVAEMNQTILGSSRLVSEQPYVGSLFKSQNGTTWTPIQNQDLMFNLVRAVFAVNTTGTVTLDNVFLTSNANMDIFDVQTNDINFTPTVTNYSYKSTTNSTGAFASSPTAFQVNRNTAPTTRQVLTTTNGSFQLITTLYTSDDSVSPIVDATRASITAVEFSINDGQLSNSGIIITDGGTGYGNVSNVTVTISAPTRPSNTGTGAGVQATAVVSANSSGKITSIVLTNRGSGYIDTPTITIGNVGGASNTATAKYIGETSQSGGNALARYITRKVTLESGFDASDLVVLLTANKQAGTDIQVYYKVLSASDPDQNFDNKYWTRMVQASNYNALSQNDDDYIEYKYVPTTAVTVPPTPISYTSGGGTYNNFKVFAIKICLYSQDTTNPPSLRDMRAIALA